MTAYLMIISELFFSLLYLLIIRKYMKVFLGPANESFKSCIEWGIYYVFLIINNINSIFPPLILLLGNLLLMYIISSSTRKRSVKQRCIFLFLMCAVGMLVEVIVLMALQSFDFDPSMIQPAGKFISLMCMLLLSGIISHCIKDNHFPEIPLLYFMGILLIPVSSIYIIHHIFLIVAAHQEYMIFSITASILLIIANYVIFEIYDRISRNVELREQNRLYMQQLELCSQQAEEREKLYLEIRKVRHDLKNHLSGLLGMLQSEQTNEAEKYIKEMLDVGAEKYSAEISNSGNIIIDSLINHAYTTAQKYNIQFNVNVLVPASLPFENGHIAIILGNLLENALEACRDIPDEKGFIYLDISYAKDIFQLCIKNNYQSKRKKNSIGHYITTKSDSIYHGLGLSSINHAIVNYHGQMDITDNDHIFQVVIVMYGSYLDAHM